jgi:hypothetical protein
MVIMAKRKRNDEEQRLYDEMELVKARRREMVEGLAASRARFEDTSVSEDKTVILLRAGNYLAAISLLRDCDDKISKAKSAYDALRAKNDGLS